MLEFKPVTRQNLKALIRLKVRPDQENLVAPNVYTLAEQAYEPHSAVFGLWNGDEAVGLLAMIDLERHPDPLLEGDVPQSAYLWRLLIDAKHQGKGYGRAAIEYAKSVTREWGYSKLSCSVVDAENSNLKFYETVGFRLTGDKVEDELVIVMDV